MKKKFTLIELLVIIAIIGILASLLLPTLIKSRKKVRQVLCHNNQKQMYTSVFMYISNNNEEIPRGSNPNGNWSTYVTKNNDLITVDILEIYIVKNKILGIM